MLNCGWDNYRRCSKIHQSGWPFTWKFNLKSSWNQREDPLNQRQPWSDLTFAEFKTWLGLYLAMEIVGKAIEEQQRENYKEEK